MERVRVNITLEQAIWEKFSALVPNRKKSHIINELLKQEVDKITRKAEERALAAAFKEASKDKERMAVIAEWAQLDTEGWD